MLKEQSNVRQEPKDHFRRWFAQEDFSLYIWYNRDGGFHGFQICYDELDDPRAFTWTEDRGYSHRGIDTGERHLVQHKGTPILVPNDNFDADQVYARLCATDHDLPPDIRDFVRVKFTAYLSSR